MKKQVFLFELDSVRQTDDEIIQGQKVLYDEIVRNGNVVVLTYNQLVDSRAFFSLLSHEEYLDSIIKLFELGAIRISQFGSIRTVAQYLLHTIDSEDNQFIYSALPIKSSQRRLIALIRRSLIFSDLSEINEYRELRGAPGKTVAELIDLFVEVRSYKKTGTNKIIEEEMQSRLTTEQMQAVLKKLYGLLVTVLRLSTVEKAYLQPKKLSEYQDYKLTKYLDYIFKVELPEEKYPSWNGAVACLQSLSSWKVRNNNRSQYLREIKKASMKEDNLKIYQYAEAIVNICTNYAYEMSICNISKHYNVEDLSYAPKADSSFFQDFLARLNQHWKEGQEADVRFLKEETNEFKEFTRTEDIPEFAAAARIVASLSKQKTKMLTEDAEDSGIQRYEFELDGQRENQKSAIKKAIAGRLGLLLLVALLGILLGILIEILHKWLFEDVGTLLSFGQFLRFTAETILFLIIGELFTTFLSRRCTAFVSLSEALSGVINLFRDIKHIFFSREEIYATRVNVSVNEEKNTFAPVEINMTRALRKYKALCNRYPELMEYSKEYPIANVSNQEELKGIVRTQELYRQQFGVVYHSGYNAMVVDPVRNAENGFYAYERVIPSAMTAGVVLVTIREGRFVLIRQFRHAIRQEQLCFPRGYGESGISDAENAKKELHEELGAIVTAEPVRLGEITADSGLSSGRAIVFLMQIADIENTGVEGIRTVEELTEQELYDKIKNHEIDDGFTLAAYSLYLCYKSARERE